MSKIKYWRVLVVIAIIAVQPVYGAYTDGYFYFNSEKPEHILVQNLNELYKGKYPNSVDATSAVEAIVPTSTDIGLAKKILSSSGFNVLNSKKSDEDIGVQTHVFWRPIASFPFPLFTKSQCWVSLSVRNEKIERVQAVIR